MEADTLGIFAQNGVYAANLFTMDAQYQLAAINLYTNYDGSGSGFGDTLVSCTTEENPIKVHPNIIYSTFCGSRMFLFSVSPLSRNL